MLSEANLHENENWNCNNGRDGGSLVFRRHPRWAFRSFSCKLKIPAGEESVHDLHPFHEPRRSAGQGKCFLWFMLVRDSINSSGPSHDVSDVQRSSMETWLMLSIFLQILVPPPPLNISSLFSTFVGKNLTQILHHPRLLWAAVKPTLRRPRSSRTILIGFDEKTLCAQLPRNLLKFSFRPRQQTSNWINPALFYH